MRRKNLLMTLMHPTAGSPGVNSSVVFLILYCFSGMDAFSYLPKRLRLYLIEFRIKYILKIFFYSPIMLSNTICHSYSLLLYSWKSKVCLGYSEYNQSLLLLMQSVCSSAVIQVFLDNLTFFKVIQVVFVVMIKSTQ